MRNLIGRYQCTARQGGSRQTQLIFVYYNTYVLFYDMPIYSLTPVSNGAGSGSYIHLRMIVLFFFYENFYQGTSPVRDRPYINDSRKYIVDVCPVDPGRLLTEITLKMNLE